MDTAQRVGTTYEQVGIRGGNSGKERDEEGDGITPGGFAGRGLPRVDFVEMEMRVMEAFAAQGLEKLVSFTRT